MNIKSTRKNWGTNEGWARRAGRLGSGKVKESVRSKSIDSHIKSGTLNKLKLCGGRHKSISAGRGEDRETGLKRRRVLDGGGVASFNHIDYTSIMDEKS